MMRALSGVWTDNGNVAAVRRRAASRGVYSHSSDVSPGTMASERAWHSTTSSVATPCLTFSMTTPSSLWAAARSTAGLTDRHGSFSSVGSGFFSRPSLITFMYGVAPELPYCVSPTSLPPSK